MYYSAPNFTPGKYYILQLSHLCFRSDGSFVQMKGAVMVFPSEVTEQDKGLYTCQASFFHHTATVNILMEVMSEEKLLSKFLPC